MNKFQQERQQVTKGKGFSAERQQNVLMAVQKTKKRNWLPIAVVVTIACFAIFFAINREDGKLEEPTNTATQAFTEKSFEETIKERMFHSSTETIRFAYIKLNKDRSHAVAVTYYKDSTGHAMLHYGQFLNDEWQMIVSSSFTLQEEHQIHQPWESVGYNGVHVAAGYFIDGLTRVLVGKKEAEVFEVAGKKAWIGEMNTAGTPVFYDDNGYLMRVQTFGTDAQEPIPFVEAVGNQYVMQYDRNDMMIVGDEYSEFPIVIDPYYYAENAYYDGDVVVVNVDGEHQLTRIVTATNYAVTLAEGSILLNGQLAYGYYTIGRWNGDPTKFTEHEVIEYPEITVDEVFVMPDNWATNGVKGIIAKPDIVGKVIGYSKKDMPLQWTDEEMALYEQFKENNFDNEVLQDIEPQTVAKIQRYAQYVKDYRTMHALYSKNSMTRSYEDWMSTINLLSNESVHMQLTYDAYIFDYMSMNFGKKQLELLDRYGNIKMTIKMERENGVWKVKYDTVNRVYEY